MRKITESCHSDLSRNARERQRITVINERFRALKDVLPKSYRRRRMSKLDILRNSIAYMRYLQYILDEDDTRVLNTSFGNGPRVSASNSVANDDGYFRSFSQYTRETYDATQTEAADQPYWDTDLFGSDSDSLSISSYSPSVTNLTDPTFIFETN